MKAALAALLAMFLTAATAAAQTSAPTQPPPASIEISSSSSPPPPDYSRDALLRLWADKPLPPPLPEHRVVFHDGVVEFRALNTRWRFNFLPFLAPLPGSYRRTNATMPDAFTMLGVEPPQTPRTWRDQRAVSKEMRRIERTERERAKIKVEPQ